MAALQARARPIAPTYEEEELEVTSLSSLDSARLDSEGDWRIIDGGNSPSAQAISLPRHDGQGIFPAAEDDQQLLASTYASARADGSWHQSSATDSSSARFSFSTSSSSADQARRSVARKRSSYQGPTEPLTEHALASVSANYDVGDDEAVLTSSSASETSDVEDLLSRTPQAASAGLSTTPKRGRVDAGVKRRHRRSGVSSHGSKRSNTSSGQSRPLPLLLAPSLPSPRSVDTRDQLFLGRVVRKVMAVDEDTLNLVAGERHAPSLPRAPLTPRYRPAHRASHSLHGLPALREHLRQELGDMSGFAATPAMDSGDETEVEHSTPILRRPASNRTPTTSKHHLDSLTRSASMSDLPNLLDSIYASLPSQLLSSPSDSISGRRLSGSVEVEPVGMARMPISYWRTLIARIKAGLENAL